MPHSGSDTYTVLLSSTLFHLGTLWVSLGYTQNKTLISTSKIWLWVWLIDRGLRENFVLVSLWAGDFEFPFYLSYICWASLLQKKWELWQYIAPSVSHSYHKYVRPWLWASFSTHSVAGFDRMQQLTLIAPLNLLVGTWQFTFQEPQTKWISVWHTQKFFSGI